MSCCCRRNAILRMENVTKSFAGIRAVRDLTLEVRRGTIHALIGPNGAGKTTVFNLATKFLQPTSGRISFKGQDITSMSPSDRAIGHGALVSDFRGVRQPHGA